MMNQNDMSIDFLLGLGPSPDGISPTGPSGAENSGPLFAEMLNDLLMSYPGAINRPVVDGEAPEVAQFGKQFELPSNGEAGQSGGPAVSIADGVQTIVEENVSAFNNDIRAQLPTHAHPVMNTAIRMNLAVPTSLQVGSYEVIESRQTDGTVTLKLADPSTPDGFIRVELPIERLSSATFGTRGEHSELPAPVKRVDLDAVPKQTTNVERLFAQLNLKQIEVSNINTDSTNDHLAIKLSGVRDGVDVQLRAQLSQDQLNTLKVESQLPPGVKAGEQKQPVAVSANATKSDQARAASMPLFVPTPAPKIRNAGSQSRSGRLVAADNARSATSSMPQAVAATENDQLLATFSQSLKQSRSATSKLVNNVVRQTTSGFDISTFGGDSEQADPFANLDSLRETGKTLAGKLSQREVRFSLPDDLASKLKPNGQSVMIRIQPDHLGPARLSLRMHQDKLSARITVETVGIKAVVERSLDRLTQQLIKSGIDVERIEVGLDGRQSGEQLSERHPHWQRQARPAHFDENNPTETNEVSPVAPAPAAASAYVGAGGVNVLA
jgi:flagellar hook-length control protein FliK